MIDLDNAAERVLFEFGVARTDGARRKAKEGKRGRNDLAEADSFWA